MDIKEFGQLMFTYFDGLRTMSSSELTTRSDVKVVVFSSSAGAGQQIAVTDFDTILAAVKFQDLDYKIVQATLTQANTDAPVLTEIVDNFGKTYTPTRDGVGEYTITASSSVFAANTVVNIALASTTAGSANAFRTSGTVVKVYTFDDTGAAADGILDAGTQIEIKVPA